MPVLSRFLAVGLIVLLSACGGQPAGSGAPTQAPEPTAAAAPTQAPEPTAAAAPTQAPEPTAAAEPTQTPAPTAAAQPTKATIPGNAPQSDGAVLLVFGRSGGIAGIDEMLTVYADGRLEFSDRKGTKTAQVAPEDLAPLQQLLASPEFAALDSRYQAPVADAFIYKITVPGNPRPFNVITMDGAQNPPVLDQVLTELNTLLGQIK